MNFQIFLQAMNDYLVETGQDVLTVKEARKEYQVVLKEEAVKKFVTTGKK